jgi:hypothetical protein
MVVTVTGDAVVVDSDVAIALDKAARGLALQPGEQMMVEAARGRGILVTSETVGKLGARGGASATLRTTAEVPIPAAERQLIVDDLTRARVGGPSGWRDREIVTQALLAQTAAGATPKFAAHDRRVVNALARMAGIDPLRLGRYKNIAEYLHYTRAAESFVVTIRGRSLEVVPIQPIRPGLSP